MYGYFPFVKLGEPSTPNTSSHEPLPQGIVTMCQLVVGEILVVVSKLTMP